MDLFQNITVTDIEQPVSVHSAKGRSLNITQRWAYALSFCVKGQITYTMDDQKYVSDQDHVILHPKGASYSLYGDKDGIFPVINFQCEGLRCDTITVLPLRNPQACLKDCERLKDLFLFKENRLKIFSTFYELLSKVAEGQLPRQDPLAPAVKYLEANITDPGLSNSSLAMQAGISEVYLRRLFLSHYGVTPKQYILNIRLQKAKQLLTDTAFTVTAISELCGFSSVYHFCRVFRERTGSTPTQYASHNRIYKI